MSRAAGPGPRTLLLAPNALSRRQMVEEALEGAPVVGGLLLKTFEALERDLTAELGLGIVDPWLRDLQLNHLAPGLSEALELPPGASPALVADLADQLGDGLDRLRLARIGWDDLETLEPLALSGAMAGLGRRYDEWLGPRVDRFGARLRLLEALSDPAGPPFRALAGVGRIVCGRSQRLSPFEAELLKALAARLEVELRLEAPEWLLAENVTHGGGWSRLRLIKDLEAAAPEGLSIIFTDPELDGRPEVPAALRRASANLFGPPPESDPPPVDGSLTLLEAPTLYHEAEEIGRRLKELIAGGIPAHRLAVAVPSVAAYLPHLDDVARRFGLGLSRAKGHRLRDQGPVEVLYDLLSLWASNWELPRLMKVLGSPYLDLGLGDPAAVRLALLKAGVIDDRAGGGLGDGGPGGAGPGGGARAEAEGMPPILRRCRQLREAGRTLAGATGWKAFRDILQSLLAGFGWPNLAADGADRDAPADPAGRPDLEAGSVKALTGALNPLFDALCGSPEAPAPSMEAFRLWLDRAVGAASLMEPDPDPMGVRILAYYDLHGTFFDHLFLAGLNDKVFPGAMAERCWWPSAFVDSLARGWLGRRLWSDAAESYQAQEAMVAQALGQARRVTLSWRTTSDNGKPALPSPLIESLRGLFAEGALPAERPGWPLPPAPGRVRDPGELWMSLAARRPGPEPPPGLGILSAAGAGGPPSAAGEGKPADSGSAGRFEAAEAEAAALWRSLEVRRGRGQLALETVPPPIMDAWRGSLRRHGGGGGEGPLVSISLLTRRLECPRRFLLSTILGLEPWPVPKEGWDPAAWGVVMHRAIEELLRAVAEGRHPMDADAFRFRFAELAWEETRRTPVGRLPVWEAQMADESRRLAGWYGRVRAGGFGAEGAAIERLEWRFDDRPDAPGRAPSAGPLEIAAEGGPIFMSGRVDRIDRTPGGGWRVTDYKAQRSKRYDADPAPDGERLPYEYQLALYGLAVSRLLGGPASARLEFIDPLGKEPVIEVPEAGEELFAGLWEALATGEVPRPADPRPGKGPDVCGSCGQARLCRRADDDE